MIWSKNSWIVPLYPNAWTMFGDGFHDVFSPPRRLVFGGCSFLLTTESPQSPVYPAVLKDRGPASSTPTAPTAASSSLVTSPVSIVTTPSTSSGRVPPPVPPRGSPRRGQGDLYLSQWRHKTIKHTLTQFFIFSCFRHFHTFSYRMMK